LELDRCACRRGLVSLFFAFNGTEFRIKAGAIRTNSESPTAPLMPHNVLYTVAPAACTRLLHSYIDHGDPPSDRLRLLGVSLLGSCTVSLQRNAGAVVMCRAPVPTRSRRDHGLGRHTSSPPAWTGNLDAARSSSVPPSPHVAHLPPHLSFGPPTHGREPDLIHSQGTGRQPTIRPNGREKPAAIGQSFICTKKIKLVLVCADRFKSPCGC